MSKDKDLDIICRYISDTKKGIKRYSEEDIDNALLGLNNSLEDLELYKKAFEDTTSFICTNEPNKYSINDEGYEYHYSKEEIQKMFLDQARRELKK